MLTRQEEEIAILENEEKNVRVFIEWLIGKEGKRNVTDSRQVEVAPEGATGAPPAAGAAQNTPV